MKEKEIKLIKDLYQHYQPQTDVTDELINSCYDQYGSIRGVLMNIILKFEPSADVSDAYLDGKLAEYGIITLQSTSPNPPESIDQKQQENQQEPSQQSTPKNASSISIEQDSEENNNVIFIICGAIVLLASILLDDAYTKGIGEIILGIIVLGIFGVIPAAIIYIFHRKNFLKTFSICCGIISLLVVLGTLVE